MQIQKTIHKLPDSAASAAPARTEARAEAAPLAEAAREAAQAIETEEAPASEPKDSIDASCPGKSKPTIVDLFPELGGHARTAAMGENGEAMEKPILRTAAMGEDGSDLRKQPSARTAAMGENGDDFIKPGKPGKFPGKPFPSFPVDGPRARTLAYPESGEDWGKLRPGKPPISPPCKCDPSEGGIKPWKPELKPWQQMPSMTKALGENGEDPIFIKPGKPFPGTGEILRTQTKGLGEGGEDDKIIKPYFDKLDKLDRPGKRPNLNDLLDSPLPGQKDKNSQVI